MSEKVEIISRVCPINDVLFSKEMAELWRRACCKTLLRVPSMYQFGIIAQSFMSHNKTHRETTFDSLMGK